MFKFKVTKGTRVAGKIKSEIKVLRNRKAINKAATIVLDKWVQKNFQAQGANHENSSLKWKPLSKATMVLRRQGIDADKKRRGKSKVGRKKSIKILQDTGRLKTSFNITATDKEGVLQSRVKYSSTHEFGEGKVPQRKIFPTEAQGVKIVRPVFEKLVKKSARRLNKD